MRFWDASAVVPLLVEEPNSRTIRIEHAGDPEMSVWWGTHVECASALERRARAGLDQAELALAYERLNRFRQSWQEVQPGEMVRSEAIRLLASYPLRAADALQLAAALVLAGTTSTSLEFVCLDSRLLEAARSERFRIGNWYSPLI